ncbi:MAG: class I SAM-dependent methyltransferase [Elusimicrobiaceae bacterium]|nr:class I SAM-dependent methyltransferase [Elusimicrobiaceae bacterium]
MKTFTKNLRRFLNATSSILAQIGFPTKKRGIYTPYYYADKVKTPDYIYPLGWLVKILDSKKSEYKSLVENCEKYLSQFSKFEKGSKSEPLKPRLNQDWFSGLDAFFAYSFVRHYKPKRVIEIGGGHSTYFLSQAIKDENLDCHFTSINPRKIKKVDETCDIFYEATLDEVPIQIFDKLKKNDILFIDASHLFRKGTDLEIIFMHILPNLKSGVIIQFHDIFLPENYPDDTNWNWWNFDEQYYLATLLQGGQYEAIMPVYHIKGTMLKDLNIKCHSRADESSFWIIKK